MLLVKLQIQRGKQSKLFVLFRAFRGQLLSVAGKDRAEFHG